MTQLGARTTGGVVTVVVSNGGTGYTAPPTPVLGGGTGAVLYSQLAGTAVGAVIVRTAGTGYSAASTVSFTGGGGTGAAGTAYAYTGSIRPITLFKGRYNELYGVDGMGRGVRWDGSAASVVPIGLAAPVSKAAITASTTSSSGSVRSIQLIDGGRGYHATPAVTITGGTPTRAARARASISGGRVTEVTVTDPGGGYATSPSVSFTGGQGAGASFTVGVRGRVDSIEIINPGSGFASTGSVTAVFSTAQGLTGAYATFSVSPSGRLQPATILSGGTGATTTGVTASATGSGTGSTLAVGMRYSVTAVTVGNSGAGYYTPPIIGFRPQAADPNGSGAAATASVDSAGRITAVNVYAGGEYRLPPSAFIEDTVAQAQAEIRSALAGKYLCCVRYIDDTPASQGGPRASSISPLAEVDAGNGIDALSWGITHSALDDRVTAAELWRTTADQSVILFRVATVRKTDAAWTTTVVGAAPREGVPEVSLMDADSFTGDLLAVMTSNEDEPETWSVTGYEIVDAGSGVSVGHSIVVASLGTNTYVESAFIGTVSEVDENGGIAAVEIVDGGVYYRLGDAPTSTQTTYTDTLSDADLRDQDRDGYAMMPITLPSGQVNARRFGVPPGEFAVGCMFQDRAWYAVDTTGLRPNSLVFSEVDEPESVPDANELVVQENTGEPDRIVALVPLGSYLLIAQQSHLYRLSYVAQPVIDASIALVGYRGVLNSRCWCAMAGVAFLVDGFGMYAFDGSSEEPISVAVDNYWRDGVIDFTKSDKFHVQCDMNSRVVRFYYCQSGDTEPVRALCYCAATKAWWEETFPTAATASCLAAVGSKPTAMHGGADGVWRRESASSTEAIPYSFRTGSYGLIEEKGSRSVSVLYAPTPQDATLNLRLHYNNSPTPRANAVSTDTGSGFVSQLGATAAQLNMSRSRSALGEATGIAIARLSGRQTPESAGGDRHVSIAMDGTQAATSPVSFYALTMEGAT